jgi:hypothetical protein
MAVKLGAKRHSSPGKVFRWRANTSYFSWRSQLPIRRRKIKPPVVNSIKIVSEYTDEGVAPFFLTMGNTLEDLSHEYEKIFSTDGISLQKF